MKHREYRLMITARFREPDHDRLNRLQEATGLSRSAVLRQAVADMETRLLEEQPRAIAATAA
jgi:predicted transcriptional regulator